MKPTPIFKTPASQAILLQRYDELLAHWPIPTEKLEIGTSFGRTFVLAWGDPHSPPLVLLHGSMANSAMWAGDAVPFARDFHVYAIDLLGEPGRSDPKRLDLASAEPARWLSQVLDGLGAAGVNLAGISMGGFYALQFASACPERVKKLVLICPGGVISTRISFVWQVIKLALPGSNDSDGAARLVYGNANVPEEAIAYTRLINAHFNSVPSLPILPDKTLARISVPTLLIVGDKDVLFDSAKTIHRLEKFLPDLQPVLLPGVGHVVVGQAERVVAFLQP